MHPSTPGTGTTTRRPGRAPGLPFRGAQGARTQPACRIASNGRINRPLEVASALGGRCVASTQTWTANRLPWSPNHTQERVSAPGDAPPLVILPGFGNNSTDYLAPFGVQDQALVTHLQARGWAVYVVPLERKDWFQVGRSLFTRGFWTNTLSTHPGYTWYLERVAATVEKALEETGAQQVDIVAHSAGGWLARAFIGDPAYPGAEALGAGLGQAASASSDTAAAANGNGSRSAGAVGESRPADQSTAALSSSPSTNGASTSTSTSSSDSDDGQAASGPGEVSPPWQSWLGRLGLASQGGAGDGEDRAAGAVEGVSVNKRVRALVTLGTPHSPPPAEKVRDMTGGALTWVNSRFPGAYFQEQGVRYICVGGRTVRGDQEAEKRTLSRYAYGGYTQVCGEGQGVEGDCVVPLASSHLPGACNITLEGAFHSMSQVGTFKEPSRNVWYGSDAVVDYWLAALVQPEGGGGAAGAGGRERSRPWATTAAAEGS